MLPISILRVECMECRQGPYNCHCGGSIFSGDVMGATKWEAYASIGEGAVTGQEHPMPLDDGLCTPLEARRDYGWEAVWFGFADWEQLRGWCRPSSCADAFFASYWHIVEYSLTYDDVLFGRHQVMFNADAATVVAFHTPTRTEEF